jgi:hypothetical protein
VSVFEAIRERVELAELAGRFTELKPSGTSTTFLGFSPLAAKTGAEQLASHASLSGHRDGERASHSMNLRCFEVYPPKSAEGTLPPRRTAFLPRVFGLLISA